MILIMPHIGEYIADIGNVPLRSQLKRQGERGGNFFQTIWQLPASHRDMDLNLLAPLLAVQAAETVISKEIDAGAHRKMIDDFIEGMGEETWQN